MKYFTKENILLALVSLLVLAQAKDMRKGRRGPQGSREAIQQRMRGMDRSGWEGRMEGMKRSKKAEEVVLGTNCCTKS